MSSLFSDEFDPETRVISQEKDGFILYTWEQVAPNSQVRLPREASKYSSWIMAHAVFAGGLGVSIATLWRYHYVVKMYTYVVTCPDFNPSAWISFKVFIKLNMTKILLVYGQYRQASRHEEDG